MSDRYAAQIEIGGQVSRDKVSVIVPHCFVCDGPVIRRRRREWFCNECNEVVPILRVKEAIRGQSFLAALMEAISMEGVSIEYGDTPASLCTERGLLECIDPKTGYLRFRDDKALFGQFDNLEEHCRWHDIPYRRLTAVCFDSVGENVYWSPGMEKPIMLQCDDNGQELVDGDVIRDVLAMLIKNDKKLYTPRIRAIDRLQKLCPTLPLPMPKFEIVD